MRKVCFSVLLLCLSVGVFSQSYQIKDISYDITGNITGTTREYPLRRAVEIDTNKIFSSIEELETYLSDIHLQFQNQRVLESTLITPTYGSVTNNNIIPVDLLIQTVDTFNLIGLPYPKYDSNSGLELRLAINHYNFLGSMLPLDFDIKYNYDTEDNANDHIFGVYTSFTLPFELSIFDAQWKNTANLSYTLGNTLPEASFNTSFNIAHEFNEVITLQAEARQGVTYNPDYDQYNDAFYLTEGASLSMPVTLAKTEYLGDIIWTPQLSIEYYWDPLDLIIDKANEDLIDTNITYQHGFSIGRVDWLGNFKDGFSASFTQNLINESYKNNFTISGNIEFKYFKAYENIGLKSRIYMFTKKNDTEELGSRVRGIRNDDIDTDSAIIINMDLPIKVWQTDWVGYGLWDWTKYLDFEMQISPFIDIALGYNPLAKTTFSPKDGWYGAGIEITGYLNAARSVVGRIMAGVDAVQFADKVGNRIDFVGTAVDKLFNTSWRSSSWYEFSFGIGLFY